MLYEAKKQVLHDIELTKSQQKVLARAVQSGAIEEPSKVQLDDEKLIVARDLLDELGIIDYSHTHNTIQINDSGVTLLQQEGIIGDDEQLTDDGNALLSDEPSATDQVATERLTFSKFLRV